MSVVFLLEHRMLDHTTYIYVSKHLCTKKIKLKIKEIIVNKLFC